MKPNNLDLQLGRNFNENFECIPPFHVKFISRFCSGCFQIFAFPQSFCTHTVLFHPTPKFQMCSSVDITLLHLMIPLMSIDREVHMSNEICRQIFLIGQHPLQIREFCIRTRKMSSTSGLLPVIQYTVCMQEYQSSIPGMSK